MTKQGKNSDHPYEGEVEVSGRVLEADVRRKRCQVWLDDDTYVSVAFTAGEQESQITSALGSHKHTQVIVHGLGAFTPEGELKGIIRTDRVRLRPLDAPSVDPNAPNIMESIAEIVKDVPDEEWDKLPADLSSRLDYYLYGIERE